MNLYSLLSVAAEATATAGATESKGFNYFSIISIVLMMGLMYVIIVLPQKKREKKAKLMLEAVVVGDKVTTIGGIVGKVINIKDDEYTIETGVEKTMMVFKKWAIKDTEKPVQG